MSGRTRPFCLVAKAGKFFSVFRTPRASVAHALQKIPTLMPEKIAFVGVGRMGANMARRLKECGYTVTAVYDVHAPSAAELAREIGAVHATTFAEVTAAADVIFTVVTDDAAQLGRVRRVRRFAACRERRENVSSTARRSRRRPTSRSNAGRSSWARSRSRRAWLRRFPRHAPARFI